VISTDNLKHFPPALVPSHVQVLSGREFAANTADVDPARAARAPRVMSRRRTRDHHAPEEWLHLLVER